MKTRPETLQGKTYKIPTGLGSLFVTINEVDGLPFEVFLTIGKSGASILAKAEVTARLTSLALRNDIPVAEVVKQLIDISGSELMPYKDMVIRSIPDALGKLLRDLYLTPDKQNPPSLEPEKEGN